MKGIIPSGGVRDNGVLERVQGATSKSSCNVRASERAFCRAATLRAGATNRSGHEDRAWLVLAKENATGQVHAAISLAVSRADHGAAR